MMPSDRQSDKGLPTTGPPKNHLRGISIIQIKISKFGMRFMIIQIKITNFSKNHTLVIRINLSDFWRLV